MALAIWQRTIVDSAGNVLPGASVEVRLESTGNLASLKSDRDGTIGIANPFTVGLDAKAKFFVVGGAYRIVATSGAFSDTWDFVAIGTAAESDASSFREKLTAARTYYVRTDGSNSNTGLVDSAGGAFLTGQKAVDAVCSIDNSIYQPTIQIRDGTFTTPIVLGPYVGQLPPIIQGNAATPANVIISTTGVNAITSDGAGAWKIRDFKIQTAVSGHGLSVRNGSVDFQNMDFGAVAANYNKIIPYPNGLIRATGPFAVSTGAQCLAFSDGGTLDLSGANITYSNSPVFSYAHFSSNFGGFIRLFGVTYTNGATVTGTRWLAASNGVIATGTGTPNTVIPGSINGTESTGGRAL